MSEKIVNFDTFKKRKEEKRREKEINESIETAEQESLREFKSLIETICHESGHLAPNMVLDWDIVKDEVVLSIENSDKSPVSYDIVESLVDSINMITAKDPNIKYTADMSFGDSATTKGFILFSHKTPNVPNNPEV